MEHQPRRCLNPPRWWGRALRPSWVQDSLCAWLPLAALMLGVFARPTPIGAAGWLISEILFNPPESDRQTEYIELRGPPNTVIPPGTCLLAVEGDSESNPGVIRNAFDLSYRRIGGNGFLVLLQQDSTYLPSSAAVSLKNTGAGGWGSGSGSTIGHAGDDFIVELDNASVTFLLVRNEPGLRPGIDLDAENDGRLDLPWAEAMEVLDSVGVLDADGPGDVAYGKVNFRRSDVPGNSATAFGKVVSIGFTPAYVARRGSGTGSTDASWAAARNLVGAAPRWQLGPAADCWPATVAGSFLDHLGAPNPGALNSPGIVVIPSEGLTVDENGGMTNFTVGLNTRPSGPVTLKLTTASRVQLSLDGQSFSNAVTLKLEDHTAHLVTVRAMDDRVISPGIGSITAQVISSGDSSQYPVTSPSAELLFNIRDDEFFLLNECKINPPGTPDGPFEFIELTGTSRAVVEDLHLLIVDGEDSPGTVLYQRSLDGASVGSNGFLLLLATNSPYSGEAGTEVIREPGMGDLGILKNSGAAVLVLSTRASFKVGMDLDMNDDGRLEVLPSDTLLIDSLGWSDSTRDLNYAEARIVSAISPDAACRFPQNTRPNDLAAWFYGDLRDGTGESLTFDPAKPSPGFPGGAFLTPGASTIIGPELRTPGAISGEVGDPSNPVAEILLSGGTNTAATWMWTAYSTNQSVLPDANITVSPAAIGAYLRLEPTGVGYSEIVVNVSDGVVSNSARLQYAASHSSRAAAAWYLGASDGSTAIPLDPEFTLVGDDENQGIRLYPRNRSSLPLARYDFSAELELPDLGAGVPREVDIEGATRVGNRVFWVGSHGHSSFGEIRTNRTRLFATDVQGLAPAITVSYVGRYDYLKLDLIRWDALNLHGKGAHYYGLQASDAEGVPPKAPDGSGFAIEGLAAHLADTNTAYIGFRAPIVPASHRAKALLLPVTNFYALASRGGPPGTAQFGLPVELDLGGRGIRSIEGNAGGYLIVAGPPGTGLSDFPDDFKLFSWSGDPREPARERTAKLTDLNPEGIIALPEPPWTETSQAALLSDCGTFSFYGDNVTAKLLPLANFKKSRCDWLELGAVVPAGPTITSIDLTGGKVRLRWRARTGLTYLIEQCDSLPTLGWVPGSGPITADQENAQAELSVDGNHRFFRVRVMEPSSG